MDRDKNSADNLQERMNILIADIMTSFRDLVNHAAAPVDNTASTGQTGYSSMALEIMLSGIIKSTEDLLSLTRKIRELWLIGPLKPPGARNAEAEQGMLQDATQVFSMLNSLRDGQRQRMVRLAADAGGGFAYEAGEVDGPASPLQPQSQNQPEVGEAAASGADGAAALADAQVKVEGPQVKVEGPQVKVEGQEHVAPPPSGQQF